jgi:RHS repeat-associated protein
MAHRTLDSLLTMATKLRSSVPMLPTVLGSVAIRLLAMVGLSCFAVLVVCAQTPPTVFSGSGVQNVSGTFTLYPQSETSVRVVYDTTITAPSFSLSPSFLIEEINPSGATVGTLHYYMLNSTTLTVERTPPGDYSAFSTQQGSAYREQGHSDYSGVSGQTYQFRATASINGSVPQSASISYTFNAPPPVPTQSDSGPQVAKNNWENWIADPVNVTTGAFYQDEVDLHVNGTFPIDIRRTYSNQNPQLNELGYGWLSAYTSYLVVTPVVSTIKIVDVDGSVILFVPHPTLANVWVPGTTNVGLINGGSARNNPLGSQITCTTTAGINTYQWQRPDGSIRRYVDHTFTFNGVPFTRPYIDRWTDARGNYLQFTIGTVSTDPSYAKVTHIQSSSGPSVDLGYTASGYLGTVTASDGRVVTYGYNFAGDLTSVQRPDGQITTYQYGADAQLGGSNHWITEEDKPDGRVLQNDYDVNGRVTQQKATVGLDSTPVINATFDYDTAGQTTVKDAFNNATVYQYTNGLQTQITDPLGHVTLQTWYTATDTPSGAYLNSLHTVTDPRGLVTTYLYDAQGNVIQTTQTGDLEGDGVTTHTATTTATYNGLNRPLVKTDASGITTTYSYTDANYPYLPTQIVTSKSGTTLRTDKFEYTAQLDPVNPTTVFSNGLLFRKTTALGSPDQAVTEYQYNTAGLVTQQKDYTGTSDPDVVTTFTYNARGEVTSMIDGDNRSTNYTYDGMSRPLTKIVKDETDTVLGTWTTTYTGNGDVATTTGPRTGVPNLVTNTYDGAGRLLTTVVSRSQAATDGSGVIAATSATTSYVHDYFGNLTSTTDANGNVTTFTYDAIGQMLSRSTAGLRTESFQYEPGGKTSQYTNPLGGITNSYYTATGQLRRQENPDGSVLEWRYYDDGRLQKEFQRNGNYWETTYDDINHKVTRTFKQAGGTVLATDISEYDLRGNLTRHTDAEGYVTTKTYDDLNRVKVVTGPPAVTGSAQQVTTMIYGASAKTQSVQNALNELSVTTSDALGRPVQTQIKSAGGAVVRTTSYSYSADHNAVTETDGTGAGAISRTVYTDTSDKTVLSVAGDGKFTRTVYDLNGNVLSSTDQLNQTTSSTYNGLNQAITQTLPDGTITTFTYNAAGGELTRGMANGTLTHEQTYDNAGRKLTERLYSGSTNTRQFSYAYYSSSSPYAGLLQTVTGPRDTVTTTYDDFLRAQTVATSGTLAETNGSTTYTYDRRNLVTAVNQSSVSNAAGPATQVSRTFDGYGQLLTEVVTVAGSAFSNVTQTWDAAGRRASLTEAGATLTSPLFAYQYQADGAMTQVTANSQNYAFAYADNGLLSSRTNPFRTLTVNSRDAVGRILQQTNTVGGSTAMVEAMTWRDNSTLNTYGVTRSGTGGWGESRAYSYNSRGQLLSEGFSPAAGQSTALTYTFDGSTTNLGIRTDAKIGPGVTSTWGETSATAINSLGRVTADSVTEGLHVIPANGISLGADHVDIAVDGVSQARATHPGYADPVGAWSATLYLAPGSHTLTVNAVHPSNQYTATASSTFTVASNGTNAAITTAYDNDGNVTTRTWATGRVQTLTWDAFGRLIKVADRDSSNNGSDWSAVYDGLGRRLKSIQQLVVAGNPSGGATTTTSIYDPRVEFLEIGVAVNGATAWKVYGPDLNGSYGSLQGTGGFEATIVDTGGAARGVINDYFGNAVGSVLSNTPSWFADRVSAYGPLPGSPTETLTDITRVAEATAWRSHRMDATGFIYLGARYYEPTSARFLSADPRGHGTSMSLYDFANGDPVNNFDANGRLWSEISSTISQTFASGGQTIQSGFAHAAGFLLGDNQAGNTVATQYFNQAMENSVSGQVLSAGGSLGQAKAATWILGGTLATEVGLVGGTALFTTGGQTSIFYSGTGAAADASAAAVAGEGATMAETLGGRLAGKALGDASALWKYPSWFFSNAAQTDEILVYLGEGGGQAGKVLIETELPTLMARLGLRPLISAGLSGLGLAGTTAATLSQESDATTPGATYVQKDSTGKHTKVKQQ